MSSKLFLNNNKDIFPIAKYNLENFSKDESVSFTGSPIHHPYDNSKFMLITDPLSEHTSFYEFSKVDVISVENLSSILSTKGESIHIIKVWIKTGVLALRYEPFIVGKTNEIIEKILKEKILKEKI